MDMNMEKIINNSIVYYINLDEHKNKNDFIFNELKKLFPINIINRISAIKHNFGLIGCCKSHILSLQHFINSNKTFGFIFEDDFEFLFPISNIQNILFNAFKNDFNVLMLTYNNIKIDINFFALSNNRSYINNGLTTCGYVVHKKFAKFLLYNFITGLNYLTKTLNNKYALDLFWFSLQTQQNKFFGIMPCIGKQKSFFSSILLKNVDYKECNTCIFITDFDLNTYNSPFFCLKFDNIDENTIIDIKNKYPKIIFLSKFTKNDFDKLNWSNIYNLYKFVIINVLNSNNSPFFKLFNNKILNVDIVDYCNDSFFMYLHNL
jgi:GR25 family glycosyltransferase involved in LPS biosynthesis